MTNGADLRTRASPPTFGQLGRLARVSGQSAGEILTVHWPVVGSPAPARLAELVNRLAARHDALRTHFRGLHDDSPEQVTTDAEVPLLAGTPAPGPLCDESPAIQVCMTRTRGCLELRFDGHHSVIDDAAARLLVRDLDVLGKGGDLPVRPSPHDLALAQRSELWRNRRRAAAMYWQRAAEDLDLWSSRLSVPSGLGVTVGVATIPKGHDELLRRSWERGTTPTGYVLHLLATHLLAERHLDGVVIAVQSANRAESDLRLLVSSQVQAVPVMLARDELADGDECAHALIRSRLAQALQHGMYDPTLRTDLGWNALPDRHTINVISATSSTLRLPDRSQVRVFQRAEGDSAQAFRVHVRNLDGGLSVAVSAGVSRCAPKDMVALLGHFSRIAPAALE